MLGKHPLFKQLLKITTKNSIAEDGNFFSIKLHNLSEAEDFLELRFFMQSLPSEIFVKLIPSVLYNALEASLKSQRFRGQLVM